MMSSPRERIRRGLDLHAATIRDLARRIYEHPEVSGAEKHSSAWCREVLAAAGFDVHDVDGLETAFVATLEGTGDGPTIGLLAEYDALPELGHACGHHLIAGAAVGAGIVLAEEPNSLSGTIRVFGCPAEETGAGKIAMLEAGAFEGTDVALTFHAHDATSVMVSSTGLQEVDFTFAGRAAHAASDPWLGASALDGVMLTFQAVNALRQFVRDGVRIHGIVTAGGRAHNVVPDRAACHFGVRSLDVEELERVYLRVEDCARAGAMASATELVIAAGPRVRPTRHCPPVADVVRANLAALGHKVEDWPALASTDFGNVTWEIPSVLFSVPTWPAGVAFHTPEAAEASGEPEAFDAMLTAVDVMAATAIDLMADSTTIARGRESLAADAVPL